MLILTFEEFNNKFNNIDNSAMSDIRIKDIGKDISQTPIKIVMRYQTPDSIGEPDWGTKGGAPSQITNPNSNIIGNLHPTEGTHWVLVIRREGGPVYYFDSFGVETPPLFLEEYVDLGSNERIQQYDESYCGAYCSYMIHLIDRGFRIKSALNILVNQVKCPEIYTECFCLGCNVNQGTCFADDNDNINDNDKDNVNDNDNQGTCLASHEQSSFADDNDKDNDNNSVNDTVNDKDNVNVNDHADDVNDNNNDNDIDNDNVNVKDNDNVNDNVNDKDKDNDNVNDNVNQGTCFADDNFIHQEPAAQIYLMENIKGVNLITIVLLTVSL